MKESVRNLNRCLKNEHGLGRGVQIVRSVGSVERMRMDALEVLLV